MVDDNNDEGEDEASEVNNAGDGKVMADVLAGIEKEIEDEKGDRAENEVEHTCEGAWEVFSEED